MHSGQGFALLSTVVVLTLAACGGSDGDESLDETPGATSSITSTTTTTTVAPLVGDGSASTEPPAAEPPATDPPATEPPATEPPATDPPATDPPVTDPPVDDGSCLEGSWLIDSEQLNGYYTALGDNSGPGLSITADGIVNLSFFDGSYQYAADFDLALEMSGIGGTGSTTGTVDGTYTTEDGLIKATNETSSLSITVEVAGTTIDGSDLGNDLITSVPIHDAPFVCGADGEGPTLMFQSGPSPDQRHPVVLKPF